MSELSLADAIRVLAEDSIDHPQLREKDRFAWAIVEELEEGTDARLYAVPIGGPHFTVTIGWATVVAEVEFSIEEFDADGWAVVVKSDGPAHLEWQVASVGPVTTAKRPDNQPDPSERVIPAVSSDYVGRRIEEAFRVARPDAALVFDPGWALHRNPFHEWLTQHDH